jgi:SOS-response transcriptional repressor LexA
LKSKFLPDIAMFFRVPISDIDPFMERDAPENVTTEARIVPASELLSATDMPLYSSVEAGQGAIVLSSDPIGTTRRPARLEGVSGSYGLVVMGTSMVPVLRPGDVVHIHPGLVPHPEDVCVFICEDNGDFTATIKEFVSQNDEIWMVKRYKPKEQTYPLKKSEWSRCEVVVGKSSKR